MTRRRSALVGCVVGSLAVAASCSSGGDAGSPTPTSESATTTSVASSTLAAATTTTAANTTIAPTTSTVPPPTAPPCTADWTVPTKVAQLVMPGVRGQDLAFVTDSLASLGIGGIVVMTWPPEASAPALDVLKHSGPVPMLIAVDEEGGDVQRMRRLGRLPSPAEVAATMTPDEAETLIADHAAVIADLGVDIVLAPVVDVAPVGGGGPIGDRSFGSDPQQVAAYAEAYVAAWQSAGVLPVLKHFPGHGRATADSHGGISSTSPLADLEATDLVPYRALVLSEAGVMVGHLDVPGLTEPSLPASLSPAAITGLLRGELGYRDALVLTDALGMGAVTSRFTVADAAVRAIAAGADIALITGPADAAAVVDALTLAVADGRIPPARLAEALTHVLAAKGYTCP